MARLGTREIEELIALRQEPGATRLAPVLCLDLIDTLEDALRTITDLREQIAMLSGAEPNGYMALLASVYTLRKPEEIENFLNIRSGLVRVLMEALPVVRNYFDPSTLCLEVLEDPEDPGYFDLVIWICTDKSPEDAVDALLRLNRDYWVRVNTRMYEDFSFNIAPMEWGVSDGEC